MKHKAHSDFWFHYRQLPARIQSLADKNFDLLRNNPRHPSLQLKKVAEDIYSARVGLEHRALAFDFGEHLVWFWVGPHDEYDRLLSSFQTWPLSQNFLALGWTLRHFMIFHSHPP